jgi:hypothetical protein
VRLTAVAEYWQKASESPFKNTALMSLGAQTRLHCDFAKASAAVTAVLFAEPMRGADHVGYQALAEYLIERQRAAVVVDDVEHGCVMYRLCI